MTSPRRESSDGRSAIRLFARHGTYACAACHRGQDRLGRKRLTLRLELGGLPSINEAFPAKAKWKHHKRYQRLRNQVERLEGPIKRYRFEKPIDTRVFAYGLP